MAKNLKLGASSSNAKELQKVLNDKLKGKLKVDGKFGSKTEEAIKEFQKKKHLKTDGEVGQKTVKPFGTTCGI